MRLMAGQRIGMVQAANGMTFTVHVDYGAKGTDVVMFGLDADRRIADDAYTVLFSNPAAPGGAATMTTGHLTARFHVDLARLPSTVVRIMFVAAHDGLTMAQAAPLIITVGDASFNAGPALGDERAVMLAEIYRHNGEWRLSAIAQGFTEGLAKLVVHLGGELAN